MSFFREACLYTMNLNNFQENLFLFSRNFTIWIGLQLASQSDSFQALGSCFCEKFIFTRTLYFSSHSPFLFLSTHSPSRSLHTHTHTHTHTHSLSVSRLHFRFFSDSCWNICFFVYNVKLKVSRGFTVTLSSL